MTITLQTVNELIASLESAGELSIREQKFLKLAKEFRICSASLDAAIKTGNVLADQNSQLAAENVVLKESRNNLAEFIHEELDADYPLNMNLDTPATDRIVAGVKADGVEEFAESQKEYVRQHRNAMDQVLRAAYAGSAVDAERFAKQLREGADK
ncbi:Uncharacterised protein [Klebsiella variicola]|uniref:hypothetical protein n=1 Tax=Klebsiella variicola TaxID=244366 RepID=UPI0007CCB20F|nr:hypothetical protein [Klebsiella variicola]SAX27283.1 Uncharacterised protein [Klebsiella variicola]